MAEQADPSVTTSVTVRTGTLASHQIEAAQLCLTYGTSLCGFSFLVSSIFSVPMET